MHALTIFIQSPYRQASLMAKCSPQQSARFKLRNQGLDLSQTTPPMLHSHFAHCSSATLNAEQEQGALLRRIRNTITDTINIHMWLATSDAGHCAHAGNAATHSTQYRCPIKIRMQPAALNGVVSGRTVLGLTLTDYSLV